MMLISPAHHRSPRHASTRGFTLVELLVVIAIIGVLIGLLLPAVQAARESARRTLCTNNLKQLGLGLHGHHDVNGRFPAAFMGPSTYTSGATSATNSGQGISWVASVLPFIEQAQLFDQINFALDNWTSGATDLNLALARANRPGYLLCPSAEARDIREAVNGSSDSNPTYTSHYYGIMGVVVPSTLAASYPNYTSATSGSELVATPMQGMFPGPAVTSATARKLPLGVSGKDVTDGLSKTYLLGEISWAGMGSQSRSEARSYLTGYNTGGSVLFIRPARNIYYPRPINISKGEWAATKTQVTSANGWNNLNWGSNHPGGTHFLMADGSVSFVQESISMDVFMAAGSRNGGEVN